MFRMFLLARTLTNLCFLYSLLPRSPDLASKLPGVPARELAPPPVVEAVAVAPDSPAQEVGASAGEGGEPAPAAEPAVEPAAEPTTTTPTKAPFFSVPTIFTKERKDGAARKWNDAVDSVSGKVINWLGEKGL